MMARRRLQTWLALGLMVCCVAASNVSRTVNATSRSRINVRRTPSSTGGGRPLLINHLKRCAGEGVCIRLLAQRGGLFAADTDQILLPSSDGFRNEAEVQRFQRRAGMAFEIVENTRIELQPAALQAFRAALTEASRRGLKLTPRGSYPARRSYATTLSLWNNQVMVAIDYWVARGELTKLEGQNLRALPPPTQVSQILALEVRRIFFGNGFKKSILSSVAMPGTSQHNVMLALDVVQYADPRIRAILGKHGWFQTVINDAPHFTYLGVEESELPARGLKRESSGGMTAWVPNLELPKPIVKSNVRKVRTSGRALQATMNVNVRIPETLEVSLSKLSNEYYDATGDLLHITSGYRSPKAQATAMYQNLDAFGVGYVLNTYRRKAAAVEIVDAYLENGGSRAKAIRAMTTVIELQISRGIYVSRHLHGRAVDIRLNPARQPVLDRIVRGMGGRLLVEIDHYHVEF